MGRIVLRIRIPMCSFSPGRATNGVRGEELVGIGAFLLAAIIAVPLTLTVIAAAWIAHRPLIGGGLIVAGLALAFLLRRLHRPPPHFLPVGR